jgi:tetratricopeptide (TPR) repeat protein
MIASLQPGWPGKPAAAGGQKAPKNLLSSFLPSCPLPSLSALLPFCLLALFLLFPADAQSQMQVSQEPPEVVAVFEAMYRYDFTEAELKMKALTATNTDQNWIDLARVNLFWWWLISGDDSRDYDHQMSVVLQRIIGRFSNRPVEKLSDEEVFTMIHSYAYLTRVDIYLERYFTGIVNLRHTLDYLKIALDQSFRYDKFMFVSGLYNYFAAATLVKYPVFTPFFALAPRSNRALGFELLNKCSKMDNILIRNESLYYLMKINYQLEEDFDGALKISDQLIRQYPNNLIYHFHRFMILIEAGRRPQALAQYSKLIEVSVKAPGLNSLQRSHMVDVAKKRLLKEKINPAL